MNLYQNPHEQTPFDEASKIAKALRQVARQTDLPPATCMIMLQQARNAKIPDLPVGDPQWRRVIGRRACRHIMTGLEPSHWQGPEFNAFYDVLQLLILTETAKPEQLWTAATAMLKTAANGEPMSKMETRLAAHGLTGSSHSWNLTDLRDNQEKTKLILESANMAIDAWPAYYSSPHPDRLSLVQEAAGQNLSEMQCEVVCVISMMENSPAE